MSELIDMFDEMRNSVGHIYVQDLPEDFTLVVEGDWTQEYKYQSAEHIVMHSPSARHFRLEQSRSGHADWYYEKTYITEVKQLTETIVVTKWVQV